ncbi:hypothetical protein PsYK624_023440 [Phanerochaete sordida]|uniref:Uncharacterized protein n=1 Tax=Phanerochaete sordida TaxID=48140 RepID=A0A9P3G1P8_9APHY|nr:hypothetical protein PsYK624_023440 [Phanerochaete sordida]
MVRGLLPPLPTNAVNTTAMFSALRKTALGAIASPELDDDFTCWEDEPPTLTVNLDALYGLVSPFSRVSWGSVAASCAGTVAQAVQRYFLDDVYELVQLMADVEFSNWEDYDFSICETAAEESLSMCLSAQAGPSSSNHRPRSPVRQVVKRRRSDPELTGPLVIKNDNADIPTIIITPCPTLPRDKSCLVPFQDVSFGNRLAVPMHPVVNEAFPPLLPQPVPYVERWRFQDGHWWAVLPTLEEQLKRGMFSRPITRRRRTHQDSWTRPQRTRRAIPKQ